MRVLTVTNMWPSPQRPHWGVFVKSQVDSLVAAGIENTLYEIEGWKSSGRYLSALRELPRIAREARAELVHAHYGLSGAAAAGVKLPLVLSLLGDDLLGRPEADGGLSLKSRALIPLSWYAARRADGVIVKSAEMRRIIARIPDVAVIPNGVDLDLFAPIPR
ncbi:MAG: glycosyltransferase, partial [Candidatus Eisenbacteria bacterium]